jgi:hypothetical protein
MLRSPLSNGSLDVTQECQNFENNGDYLIIIQDAHPLGIWHRVKALPGPHLRMAVRSRGFEFASPPPIRAAMVISRMIRVKTRPRFASVAAFLWSSVRSFCPRFHARLKGFPVEVAFA